MPMDLPTLLAWVDAGCSLIPVRNDGTKRPDGPWKTAQSIRADHAAAARWATTHDGIGVVCGAVSGHLEMLELEGRAVREGYGPRLRAACRDNGVEDVLDTLMHGLRVDTPSGGIHLWYRVADGPSRPNTKLARRPATTDELAVNPDERIKVLIETRGQGGFAVVPPSAGAVHPTHGAWTTAEGSPASIPTITAEQRDALHAVATLLDEQPVAEEPATAAAGPRPTGTTSTTSTTGKRPGDAFNETATWDDILIPRGWTKGRPLRSGWTWRRPGKTDDGISATTGQAEDADRLYVFTTSTEFDAERPYSKFAAYTLLEHGRDWAAATRALRRDGYGDPLPQRDQPRTIIPPSTTAPAAPAGEQPATDGTAALASVHPLPTRPEASWVWSDDSNALALIDRYGTFIRYCTDRGRWLAWDGTRWEWQALTGGAAREYAKQFARDLPDDDKATAAWKKRSLSSAGTTAMLTQAATDPRITVTMSDLDAHPWELNTPAGIVDLRTGAIGPNDPAKLHTRITSCAPDQNADPAAWAQFLADTFDNPGLTDYLRRLVGYSAIGVVGPHVLPFCHGSGGNGKGVFLEVLVKVLGDYGTTAPSGFLMATRNAQHETEIARLAGARMVLCSEVNEDDRFDEAKVKQLTGGDTLTARFMRQDHFTFTATHQLWLMGNHKPAVRSGGRSFWRRLRLIPFEREVPEDKMVDDLQGLLYREHGHAILAWIIAGAAEYAAHGLQEPESVRAATADYAHDQDTVGRFVEECCRIGGGEHVQIKVGIVRRAYEAWCASEGEQAVTAKAFGLALRGRFGIDSTRTKSSRMYVGLSLQNASPNASPDASPNDEEADPDAWFR